ncbi:MAG: glycosyltransferase family 2 protein [Lachnospiraceae bacterium]|nr:glycosyltransferase family 2 protein [Lachnospiraceae bacterium]
MITVSLCMIVKNEEAVLARCLDSVADLVEEIVIVDTGSVDATKQIAARYGAKLYDFEWIDDFSAARNFAFSKCTQEYIYSADADEVLEGENRDKFRKLKEVLLPEIDMVQMYYGNQLEQGTVYNFDKELRPKLFRRLRPFVWEEPVHEQVRLSPMIYDSDIVISHRPIKPHGGRDIAIFGKQIREGRRLSKRLFSMYARELYLVGTKEELAGAMEYFKQVAEGADRDEQEIQEAGIIVLKAARLLGDDLEFFKYVTRQMGLDASSEVCAELGAFYEEKKDYEEAAMWYYNAAFETVPILSLAAAGEDAAQGMQRCYAALGRPEDAVPFVEDIRRRKITPMD